MGQWEQALKRSVFSELTMLKNANLCSFSPKFTVLAYFDLIRQLVHDPHRTSIALSVFTMILTDRQMVVSPLKTFFTELTIFKNANLHIFDLNITVFANFEHLGQLIETPHGTSTTFSVFSMTLTVGSLGTSPQKKCFFRVDYLENC